MLERLRQALTASGPSISGLPRASDSLLGVIVIAIILATWPQWGSIYAGYGAFGPTLLATLGSVLLGMAVAERTGSPTRSVPAGMIIFVLGAAAWYGGNSNNLISDLVQSWKSLASTGLLIPTTQEFVIVPVVTSWIAGWICAEIIIRRQPIGAAVAPLAGAHAVALAYTVSQREPTWWLMMLLGLLVLLMFGISAAANHPGSATTTQGQAADQTTAIRWRQALTALPLAAALAAGGIGFGQFISAGTAQSFDLRDRLVRPLDIFESTSPLSRVKGGLIEQEPEVVFTIVVEDLPTNETITLIPAATLDLYNGALWTSSARFEPAGATLPLPDQPQALQSRRLRQTVAIEAAYPFRFLPRVGQIVRTDSPLLGWDPRSGSLANTDSGREAFTFVTLLHQSGTNVPDDAALNQPLEQLRYAAVSPALNEDQASVFQDLLASASESAATEFEILQNLEQILRSPDFAYNPEAPAGHSLAALASYVNPDSEDGSDTPRIGFTEQSAATFAVAARQLGIPSRVVVGYRLTDPITWDDNRRVVTEDMIHAWPEVWVNGPGWVRFEPTNDQNATSEQTARTPAIGDDASAARASSLPDLQDPILIPEPASSGSNSRRLVVLGILLALPIVFMLAVALAKRVRRSRRRQGEPADRISGAWLETRELLESYGLPSSDSSTVIEIAEQLNAAGHMKVAVPVAKMASTVSSALYAPELPTEESAKSMWHELDQVTREAALVVPRHQRLKATINPKSLVRK